MQCGLRCRIPWHIAIGVSFNLVKHVLGDLTITNFFGILFTLRLAISLSFTTNIVYFIYDKFKNLLSTSNEFMYIVGTYFHVSKRGIFLNLKGFLMERWHIKLFSFFNMTNGSIYSLSGSMWVFSIIMHLAWETHALIKWYNMLAFEYM